MSRVQAASILEENARGVEGREEDWARTSRLVPNDLLLMNKKIKESRKRIKKEKGKWNVLRN